MTKSVQNSRHYKWGNQCVGWHLLEIHSLSVIQERMGPGSSETTHYHRKSHQFFYILEGTATFIIDDNIVVLNSGESVHIPPGTKHNIKNKAEEELHFLVISSPKSHGDKILITE